MAAKRLAYGDKDHNDDERKEKRMKSMPSFASLVEMVISRNAICNVVEPWCRKVVAEEVERALERRMPTLRRSPSLRIQAPEPTTLKLIFTNKSMPRKIFTCNKILDENNQPLQLVLIEQRGDVVNPTLLPHPIKVEIVAIYGDFPVDDQEIWSVDEFNRGVVKERSGKRPLLTKELNYIVRDNSYVTLGDVEFTDNSSWVPCRKFRLGARVVAESSRGVRVLEALTDAFVVKDHRGELYQKHYPPSLGDEVWRLEKISKDGTFHQRLAEAGIKNVQDLLKLSVINPTKLRMMLGGKNNGIPEKMWDSILKHARTCNLGNKLYIASGTNCSVVLDPICQIFSIKIGGQSYTTSSLNTPLKAEVDQLVANAYNNWNSLQEVDRPVNDTFRGSQGAGNLLGYGDDGESMAPYEYVIGGIFEVGIEPQFTSNNNLQWIN